MKSGRVSGWLSGVAFVLASVSVAASHGGTSSGGPPADLYVYVHCTSVDQSVTADYAGTLGYAGGTAPGTLPGVPGVGSYSDEIDPCHEPWRSATVANTGLEWKISAAAPSEWLDVHMAAYPTGSPPWPLAGTLTPAAGESIPVTCTAYSGFGTKRPCPPTMVPVLTCAAFPWQVCVSQ